MESADISLEDVFPDGAACQNCTYDEDAIAYCHTCKRRLCEECLAFHKRQVDTCGHPISDSPRAEELKQLYRCKQHDDKALDYFCKTCNLPICQHCQVTGCRGHELVVSTDIKKEMKELLERVKENKEQFSHHAEFIEARTTQNGDALNQCEGEINQAFDTMLKELESNRKTLLAQLHNETKKNRENVELQREYIKSVINEMEKTIEGAENLLSTKKDAKLMVNKARTCADLEGRASQIWTKAMATFRSWQLEHKDQQEYASRFSSLLPKPSRDAITVTNLTEARVGIKNVFTITAGISDQFDAYDPTTVTNFLSVRMVLQPTNQGYSTLVRRNIARKGNVWTVSYFLRQHGKVSISVSMCGVKVGGDEFSLHTDPERKEIKAGDTVVRGPDWKWENQDGGEGNKGVVVDLKRKGWVIVKWDKTKHDYRFGAQDAFDLEVVDT